MEVSERDLKVACAVAGAASRATGTHVRFTRAPLFYALRGGETRGFFVTFHTPRCEAAVGGAYLRETPPKDILAGILTYSKQMEKCRER